MTLMFSERWSRAFERASLAKPEALPRIRVQHLKEQQYVYESLLKCGSKDSAGLYICAEDINIRSPLLMTERPCADEVLSDGGDVQEIGEPFELGKSFLMGEKLRMFKNTDFGNIPWTTGSSSKKVAPGGDDNIEFFENAAKPPTKRERQSLPGIKSKNLNQTAENVLLGHQNRRPIMQAGLVTKRARGRPAGGQAVVVKRTIKAHDVAKNELREANKRQQVGDSGLEQQRKEKLAEMKERILKNKQIQEKNKELGVAAGAAAAVLAPTLAPAQKEEVPVQEATKKETKAKSGGKSKPKDKSKAKEKTAKEKGAAKEKATKATKTNREKSQKSDLVPKEKPVKTATKKEPAKDSKQ